jgi:hypothetical protein
MRRGTEKALGLKSLTRDFLGLAAVVDLIRVGSMTGMPPRRVFRHTWRDSTLRFYNCSFYNNYNNNYNCDDNK